MLKKSIQFILIISFLVCIGGCKTSNTIENVEYDELPKEDILIDYKFLQLENNDKNKVYSPLSIKSALKMLYDAADGETKKQIGQYVSNYTPYLCNNDEHKAIGNAFFIKDSFADSVNKEYIEKIKTDYYGDVLFDSFNSPDVVNNWINKKTLGMINNLMNDIHEYDYFLVNALGIDMEWERLVKNEMIYHPLHEAFSAYANDIESSGFDKYIFNDNQEVSGLAFVAAANKYDIVKDLGEDYIRDLIFNEYSEWLASEGEEYKSWGMYFEEDPNVFTDNFIQELKKNYGDYEESTDFGFYVDDSYRIFEKELKEYDGLKLEYIAIMPMKEELSNFINNTNEESINALIGKIKRASYDVCEEGYITKFIGLIPTFNFKYELDFMNDLKELGIKDCFDTSLADLSNLAKGSHIDEAIHSANIEFANEGIKATAATVLGGKGAGSPGFEHLFDVPVIEIDLTFDRPFMFIIRDVNTKENWFVGTVYEPTGYRDLYNEMFNN